MAEEWRTLRDYWENVKKDFPEGTPEHIKVSLEAMFFTGSYAFECLLDEVLATTDPFTVAPRLNTIRKEIQDTFDELEKKKQKIRQGNVTH